MATLRSRELRAFASAMMQVTHCESLADFPGAILSALQDLIEADYVTLNLVQTRQMGFVAAYHAPHRPGFDEGMLEAFNAHVTDHPTVERLSENENLGREARWSDFTTLREFRRTALFNEYFRKMGVRHQLSTMLGKAGQREFALSLNRARQEFTKEEATLLELLGAHSLRLRRLHEQEQRLACANLALRGQAVLLATRDGKIHWLSPAATRLLSEGRCIPAGLDLEKVLAAWLRQEGAPFGGKAPLSLGELCFEYKGERSVSESPVWGGEEGADHRQVWHLVLVSQRRGAADLKVFRGMGLTARESEILFWIAHGKRNGEIALILEMAVRTVDKHCQHLFEKLQVENRTTAAARAWEILNSSPQRGV